MSRLTIERQWQKYEEKACAHASAEQRAIVREVFYAGAFGLLMLLFQSIEPGPDGEIADLSETFEALDEECRRELRTIEQRTAAEGLDIT